MKYKGINKYYFGIGIRDDFSSFNRKEFYFYFFKLIRRGEEGESLCKKHYKGFIIEKSFRIPNIGIDL